MQLKDLSPTRVLEGILFYHQKRDFLPAALWQGMRGCKGLRKLATSADGEGDPPLDSWIDFLYNKGVVRYAVPYGKGRMRVTSEGREYLRSALEKACDAGTLDELRILAENVWKTAENYRE